jgi:hypothetical protein
LEENFMNAGAPAPTDRASFIRAMADVRADHAALRRLAASLSMWPALSSDNAMSLVDAMIAHENAEARLFSLPLLTRPPAAVATTAARARRRCIEYSSGSLRVPDPKAAAAIVVDALLIHLAVEDAWLAHEEELHHERLLNAI